MFLLISIYNMEINMNFESSEVMNVHKSGIRNGQETMLLKTVL